MDTQQSQLVTEALFVASHYVGMSETSNNDADWLEKLMKNGGNPCHWQPPMPYCISAACAVWGQVLAAHSIAWPFQPTAGTQLCYENAAGKGLTTQVPHAGDIVIYRDGNTGHGHAGIVTGLNGDNLFTVEFNTSPNHTGNQREGEGCYNKVRNLISFKGPKTSGLWVRGFIAMSSIPDPITIAAKESPSNSTGIIS